jgi:archaellum biogenesis ATPase FlaH
MGIREAIEHQGFKLIKKTAGEYSCPCPFCGGEDRFCVWPEKNNAWCRQCDWKGDDIQLLRELEGFSFQEAAVATGKGHKVNNPKSERKPASKKKKEPDVTYDYPDEQGKILFQVCRYNLLNGGKAFSQRRPDGKGGWIDNVKGVLLVLYGLPEVIKAQDILFCEGEKNVKDVRKLGYTSTCNPMGAGKIENQHKKHKILDPLKNKNIFILADNDTPGEEHALQVAELAYPIAKSVKIIQFDELPEKGDVSNFIIKHGDKAKDKLFERIIETPEWTPPKAFYTLQEICDLPPDDHIPIIDKGIMPYNSHILIAGESGVGKSMLRLEIALRLAMGWDWMGFHVPRARTVAVFQFENSEHTEQFRIKKMLAGMETTSGAIGDRIKYVKRDERYNLTLKGDREKLFNRVKDLGCEVIIYDCLSNLHSANENDNVKMREVLDVLVDINAKLGTSCIVIHHFGKPSEFEKGNVWRIRGASSIMDWAYTALTFTHKPHEEKTLRKIEFVKVRDGKQPKPFYVERDPETFLCSYYDEESLVSPNLIADVLKEKFDGMAEKQSDLIDLIMERTGCGNRTARTGLKNALKMKVIYESPGQTGRSKSYRLPMSKQWG